MDERGTRDPGLVAESTEENRRNGAGAVAFPNEFMRESDGGAPVIPCPRPIEYSSDVDGSKESSGPGPRRLEGNVTGT